MAKDGNVPASGSGGFRVQMDELDYRLVGPDEEEGGLVEYGQPAALVIGSAIYYSLVADPNEAGTPAVYRVDSVTAVEAEAQEVEFAYPDEDEGEEDEEGDGDGALVVDEGEPEDEPGDEEVGPQVDEPETDEEEEEEEEEEE